MYRQWIIEAYSSKDLKDFDRIVADDFMITGGNGKVQTTSFAQTDTYKPTN